MDENQELTIFEKALIGIIPFTLVLALILFFVTGNDNSEVKSLTVGAAVSLIFNFWNYKTTAIISERYYRKLRGFSIFSFILRYLIIIAVIVLSCVYSDFNAIYIVFGFFEYPLFIIILSILSGKGGSQNA